MRRRSAAAAAAAGSFIPVVRDILIERLTVRRARYAFFIRGLPGAPTSGMVVRDSAFHGVARGSLLEHVDDLVLHDVVVQPSKQPPNQEETR